MNQTARKPVTNDLVAAWMHQRRTAWDDWFLADEMVGIYEQANKTHRILHWRERRSIASGKAQYFDALIAAAIDPTFQRDWAHREGVEL